MPFGGGDDLAATWHVGHDGDEVPHGARGNEEARLFTEQGCGTLLKGSNGRIVLKDVVADLRLGHGAAHFWGWMGHRVGAPIDAARPAAS
jgi:hypothetical protein